MKIYTKTGDEGLTGLFGGSRVAKDHPRITAYGTVDELNASLGFARTYCRDTKLDELLAKIQNELFAVGAELATEEPEAHGTHWIGPKQIEDLEKWIDDYESGLKPLSQFILPAGSPATAAMHMARSICRRAERCVVTLGGLDQVTISSDLIIYLNRLGDLLFVLSRVTTASAGLEDVPWEKPSLDS